jgi:hypothetical protein
MIICKTSVAVCSSFGKEKRSTPHTKKNSLPSNYERKVRRYLELKFIPETTLTLVNGTNLVHQMFSEKIVLCKLG